MCGRTLLTSPVAELRQMFGFVELPNLKQRWNIAPTQDVPVIRRDRAGIRHLDMLRWGLVPGWAKDPGVGSSMINARAETVAGKPSFRSSFRQRRCLVPVDGFYEWTTVGKRRQGHLIHRRDRHSFALAGLWEQWTGPKGGPALDHPLESFTIVTTTSNSDLSWLHERMPAILSEEEQERWLDPSTDPDCLLALLHPAPAGLLTSYPVGPAVNAVRNDNSSCAIPFTEQPDAQASLF